MKMTSNNRETERGSASIKLVMFLAGLFVIGNAGYNYVPVAYNAESLKTEMQTSVMQGLALPGKMNPVDNVKARVQAAMLRNGAPPDATLEVKQSGSMLTAHVAFNQPVGILPFGIYKYNYKFDFTATPTGFLLKQ